MAENAAAEVARHQLMVAELRRDNARLRSELNRSELHADMMREENIEIRAELSSIAKLLRRN